MGRRARNWKNGARAEPGSGKTGYLGRLREEPQADDRDARHDQDDESEDDDDDRSALWAWISDRGGKR